MLLCEGFSVEQMLFLSLHQPSHQVKMKAGDKGPSRGLVPCGPPSAEAKGIVSITLHHHIKEKSFTFLYYKYFLFLIHCCFSAQSDQRGKFICVSSGKRWWMFGHKGGYRNAVLNAFWADITVLIRVLLKTLLPFQLAKHWLNLFLNI